MTIQTTSQILSTSPSPVANIFYAMKEHLKNNAGWSIAGSGDGVASGAMDAVDRITSPTVMNDADAWFVIQSPHVASADRIQFLFDRASAVVVWGSFWYNPNADFSGGGPTTLPTSSFAREMHDDNFTNSSGDSRIHMLADDAPPYGWAILQTVSGTPGTPYWGMCFCPLIEQPVNPGKPYWVWSSGSNTGYLDSELYLQNLSNSTSGGVAERQNPPNQPTASAACRYQTSSGVVFPGVSQNASFEDLHFPVVIAQSGSPGEYFGVTDFMRWNGTNRNNLDTFNNGERICFGDVNFPWDGSVPNP